MTMQSESQFDIYHKEDIGELAKLCSFVPWPRAPRHMEQISTYRCTPWSHVLTHRKKPLIYRGTLKHSEFLGYILGNLGLYSCTSKVLIYSLSFSSFYCVIKVIKKLIVIPLVLRLVKTAGNIVLLQRVDGRHVFLGQLKIERVEVGLDSRSSQ